MFPIDIDTVELRIDLQEIRAGLRERQPSGIGRSHVVKGGRVRPSPDRHEELHVWMVLLQERDLMKQSVLASRFVAIARVHAIHRHAGVHGKPVVGADLAECVVHVRQLVCRNVHERISLGRPLGVVADDMKRGRGRRRGVLSASATDPQS
jgi:hypothetical protein